MDGTAHLSPNEIMQYFDLSIQVLVSLSIALIVFNLLIDDGS